LSSISGGTDIISCFLLGNPNLPVYSGELQCKGLGLDVKVLNGNTEAILNDKGELTCVNAFPSMPVGFWNDNDNKKYKAAYYDTFENVWCQSDMAEEIAHINGSNGFVIHGRSDTVLNPGGVRIGTAEIYRQIDQISEIKESVVIGKNTKNDVKIVLFVVLIDNVIINSDLKIKIKKAIQSGASPRHVPSFIVQVKDTPKTLSGKISEKVVMNIINGYAITNKDTLANPKCLDEYEALKNNIH
jgi:acetoacetyl-CoA synthetase